jgi:hypothetical protein
LGNFAELLIFSQEFLFVKRMLKLGIVFQAFAKIALYYQLLAMCVAALMRAE